MLSAYFFRGPVQHGGLMRGALEAFLGFGGATIMPYPSLSFYACYPTIKAVLQASIVPRKMKRSQASARSGGELPWGGVVARAPIVSNDKIAISDRDDAVTLMTQVLDIIPRMTP
jgi:hypothetical protein